MPICFARSCKTVSLVSSSDLWKIALIMHDAYCKHTIYLVSIDSLIDCLIDWFIDSFIYSFIHSLNTFIHLFTNPLVLIFHLVCEKWPKLHRAWWRHQMETFIAVLALCAGNSPVPGKFPSQRPVTRSFDIFFDLRMNKRLNEQSLGWWFETPSRSLWRYCNGTL